MDWKDEPLYNVEIIELEGDIDVSISSSYLSNTNPSLTPRSPRSVIADLPQVLTQDARVADAGCCRTVCDVSPKKTACYIGSSCVYGLLHDKHLARLSSLFRNPHCLISGYLFSGRIRW